MLAMLMKSFHLHLQKLVLWKIHYMLMVMISFFEGFLTNMGLVMEHCLKFQVGSGQCMQITNRL